jgi:hypothetical protein
MVQVMVLVVVELVVLALEHLITTVVQVDQDAKLIFLDKLYGSLAAAVEVLGKQETHVAVAMVV